MPVHDVYSALGFATGARDVKMTMVAGEVLFTDGCVKRVDEDDLKRQLTLFAEKMHA